MVIRQNIAVLRDDEAGAGGGGCRLEAPVVCRDGRRDADGGIDVGRIDLRRRHLLTGVDLCDVDDGVGPLPFLNDCMAAGSAARSKKLLPQDNAPGAHRAANDGATQGQGYDPGAFFMRLLRLFRLGRLGRTAHVRRRLAEVRPCVVVLGRLGLRVRRVAAAGVAGIVVVVIIEAVVVFHIITSSVSIILLFTMPL